MIRARFKLTPAQTRMFLSWGGSGGATTDQRVGDALARLGLVAGEVVRRYRGGRMGGRYDTYVEYIDTPLGRTVSEAVWQQARTLPDYWDDSAWVKHPGLLIEVEADEDSELVKELRHRAEAGRRNPTNTAQDRVHQLDGTPYFSPAALQHALDEAGPRSRTTIVAMSPDDFIRLAEKGYDRDKADTVQALVKQGTRFHDVPFLLFRNLGDDALVTGHEGRHRAMALRAEGVKLMPVRLVSQEYKAIPIRWSQWQDGPELGDVWPKRLWAEDTSEADIKRGRTKGASCPFPDSLIYPRRQS